MAKFQDLPSEVIETIVVEAVKLASSTKAHRFFDDTYCALLPIFRTSKRFHPAMRKQLAEDTLQLSFPSDFLPASRTFKAVTSSFRPTERVTFMDLSFEGGSLTEVELVWAGQDAHAVRQALPSLLSIAVYFEFYEMLPPMRQRCLSFATYELPLIFRPLHLRRIGIWGHDDGLEEEEMVQVMRFLNAVAEHGPFALLLNDFDPSPETCWLLESTAGINELDLGSDALEDDTFRIVAAACAHLTSVGLSTVKVRLLAYMPSTVTILKVYWDCDELLFVDDWAPGFLQEAVHAASQCTSIQTCILRVMPSLQLQEPCILLDVVPPNVSNLAVRNWQGTQLSLLCDKLSQVDWRPLLEVLSVDLHPATSNVSTGQPAQELLRLRRLCSGRDINLTVK